MSEDFERFDMGSDMVLFRGDCLDVMRKLRDEGVRVNLVLADPPYSTTHCRWDVPIDLTCMWEGISGISFVHTPTLLFCQQPFATALGGSNLKDLRYNWIWEKPRAQGFLNANRMPMRAHEEILVFYKRLPVYHAQKTEGHCRKVILARHREKCDEGEVYGEHRRFTDYDSRERYPRSVLKFATDRERCNLHPTQKPVALLEYFIRTYTDEGGLVLDFCMGSGSTGAACLGTNRRFIGIENDRDCFGIAKERLSGYEGAEC